MGAGAAKLWPAAPIGLGEITCTPPPPLPTPFLGERAGPGELAQAMDASFSAVTYCRKVVGQEGVSPKRADPPVAFTHGL